VCSQYVCDYAGIWPMNKDIFSDADFEGAFVSDRTVQLEPVIEPDTTESSAASAINHQPAAGNHSAAETVVEPTSNASVESSHPIASSSNSLAVSSESNMLQLPENSLAVLAVNSATPNALQEASGAESVEFRDLEPSVDSPIAAHSASSVQKTPEGKRGQRISYAHRKKSAHFPKQD